MKRKTRLHLAAFIILCALAACTRQAAPPKDGVGINAENFPDQHFRDYLLSQPYGTDHLLSEEEIAAITSLDLTNRQISDLTGIAHFTALKDLACVGNQLTTLDISGCQSLNYLNCSRNRLTTLDLTDCPALNYLDCGLNQLTALDLAGCPALAVLSCPANQLTALDLSRNPQLTTLICSRNLIGAQATDTLISSLPTNQTDINHSIYVYSNVEGDERNVCTKAQVAKAKTKGWTPYYYNSEEENWEHYDGSTD